MPAREHGIRRVALATTGLVTAGVAGTAVLAAVAYADTRADRGSATQVSTSTSSGPAPSSSANSGTPKDGNTNNSNSGPVVTTTTGPGQVTTGGS